MKLFHLAPLYRALRNSKQTSTKFIYTIRDLKFDVFFTIDCEPFKLLFGHIGKDYLSFTLDVRQGFDIDPTIDKDTYYTLAKLLGTDFQSGNKLKMFDFFKEFDNHIPSCIIPYKPSDKARYHRDVEEVDKINFIGWRNKGLLGGHVTSENLQKTRAIFSEKFLIFVKHIMSVHAGAI